MRYMQRRKVLQIGVAAAALPAIASAQEKPHPEPVSEAADQPGWKPQVFDAHQNQTVIVLTGLIIPATDTPGAKEINANRYLDLFLADGPNSERTRFLEGLSWLDGYSISKYSHPFVAATADQQITILKTLDANEEPDVEPGHRFFRMAKSMTSMVYYNTQSGFREMNKGGRVPDSFGCHHPEHAS
jgi:hypothetical protein